VNAKQFVTLISKGNSLQKEDFQDLVKLHDTFPYFALPRVLAAKYEMEKLENPSQDHLHWAALQSPDRLRLKELLEQPIDFLPMPTLKDDPAPEEKVVASTVEEPQPGKNEEPTVPGLSTGTPIERREEILKKLEENLIRFKKSKENPKEGKTNKKEKLAAPPKAEDLLETIKKKEKKAISDTHKKEQLHLIKAFNKKNVKISMPPPTESDELPTDLSKKSTLFNNKLISPSYAKLLAQQGKKEDAIEIYKKLILKFPDKSTYFANLIKKLED